MQNNNCGRNPVTASARSTIPKAVKPAIADFGAVAAPNPMMSPMLVTMPDVPPKLNMRGLSIAAASV
jgi:hypothetical protein